MLRRISPLHRKRGAAPARALRPHQGPPDLDAHAGQFPGHGRPHHAAEVEVELGWAYNRWLTEKALPASGGRFYSMLCLPFSEPDEALRHVETFGDRSGVTGFMITSVRSLPVHHNAYMKVYRAMEERGPALGFHSADKIGEPVFKSLNRLASVHALGFPFYNMIH